MSTHKAKFTLHNEYKDFVPEQTQIQFETLLPPNHEHNHGCNVIFLMYYSLIGVCLAAFAVACIGMSAQQVIDNYLFSQNGQLVTGQVRHCRLETPNSSRLSMSYTYIIDNHSSTGQVYMDGAGYKTCSDYPTGTPLEVLYLPDAPYRSRIPDQPNTTPFDGLLLGILILGGSGLFIGWIAYTVRQGEHQTAHAKQIYPRLREAARLIEGEIVSIRGYEGNKKGDLYIIAVHYEFEVPRKRVLKGYAEAHRQDLKGADLPAIGTPVAILYADDSAYMAL